jgi:hypothetical protein
MIFEGHVVSSRTDADSYESEIGNGAEGSLRLLAELNQAIDTIAN